MENSRIIKINLDTVILPFNCDNSELNGFLFDDAKNHQNELITTTFLLINDTETIAYWSYLNDKITIDDIGNLEKFKERIALCFGLEIKEKEYKSFPAVKIGRLAVNINYKSLGIGRQILDYTKELFVTNNKKGCKFITVDAFKEATIFYEKNGFTFFSSKDRKSDTRQMYYDLNRKVERNEFFSKMLFSVYSNYLSLYLQLKIKNLD